MTRYLMAVYGPADYDDDYYGYDSEEAMQQSLADTTAFNETLKEKGYWVFADGLDPAAQAKVVDGQGAGAVITDGPFPEAKEHVGGFWIIDAPDLDVALELAAQASKACRGKVEVRAFQTELPA